MKTQIPATCSKLVLPKALLDVVVALSRIYVLRAYVGLASASQRASYSERCKALRKTR